MPTTKPHESPVRTSWGGVRFYPGSYSDWSRSGMPVATGDAPGDPPGAVAGS